MYMYLHSDKIQTEILKDKKKQQPLMGSSLLWSLNITWLSYSAA